MPPRNHTVIATGPDTDQRAVHEQMRYFRIVERRRENPFVQIHLAQITKIEKDDQGRFTGRVAVDLLTMPGGGTRVQVLVPLPASQNWFVGGIPPINTLCTLGFLPQGVAVILAYHMHGLRQLIDVKGLPDLQPGEIYLQSEVTENSLPAAGGTVYLDQNGDVTIQDKNKNTIITLDNTGNVTITASTKVTVNAPEATINADEVHLGGESGNKLVDDTFITFFNTHIHTATGPTAPTTMPTIASTGHTTDKTKAE